MLGKAVQKHVNSQAPKGIASQSRSNTLQPSPSTVLNAPRPIWPSTKNPLKRTASEAMGSCQSRDHDVPHSSLSRPASKDSLTEMSQSSTGGGRVGKLHNTVFFDENDFDDDANVDLDSDSASSKTLVNSTDVSYPTLPLPTASATPVSVPVPSSAPIPWSSSPLLHKLPPRQAPAPTLYPTLPESEISAASKVSKRRTLPWLEETGDEPHNRSGGIPAHVQALIERSRNRKAAAKGSAVEASTESFTPLLKDKQNLPFPWNKTNSAVKKEQKALREGHKRLVKATDKQEKSTTTTRSKRVPRVMLSNEQRKVLDLVVDGQKSVFFTGSAGTGKSVLLREIIRVLRDRHKRETDRVAVTASTGLAACNVGGVTLHSFASIGLGKEAVPELVRKIKRNGKSKLRWMRTKILVIDEISMVDGDLFDKLEAIARIIRNNGRPFGGIQLVITGDFFQLPPVPDYGRISKFAFDAATWNTSIENTIGLTEVFRQKDPGMAVVRRTRESQGLILIASKYSPTC